jgi:hypothetical protein
MKDQYFTPDLLEEYSLVLTLRSSSETRNVKHHTTNLRSWFDLFHVMREPNFLYTIHFIASHRRTMTDAWMDSFLAMITTNLQRL